MCVIYGTLFTEDTDFYKEQHKLALQRGKDPISVDAMGGKLFHYRIPTNQSKDVYPVLINGEKIAMNGIVSQSQYAKLVEQYGSLDYSLDTAYLLTELQRNGYNALDTLDYVFAFWLIRTDANSIVLANKDYPLYIKTSDSGLWFSSFEFEGSEPLNNEVIEIYHDGLIVTDLYKYTNLIYGDRK